MRRPCITTPTRKLTSRTTGGDWYAAYLDARLGGAQSGAAVESADRYMDEVLHVAAS